MLGQTPAANSHWRLRGRTYLEQVGGYSCQQKLEIEFVTGIKRRQQRTLIS